MLGAIIGDIIGSRFEYEGFKSKKFKLFSRDCFFTDDSVMTCAVADALLNAKNEAVIVATLQKYGRNYPNRGYGGSFRKWLMSKNPQPYDSYGN